MDDRIEQGLALLKRSAENEIGLPEAVNRIESVSSDPKVIRSILDRAELQGIIKREDGVVKITSTAGANFENEIITKKGKFQCRRCNCGLSTGYFINTENTTIGPFGSSCIQKVTGRE